MYHAQLRKEYSGSGGNPPQIAVETISLAIQRNECFGLLGPNGMVHTILLIIQHENDIAWASLNFWRLIFNIPFVCAFYSHIMAYMRDDLGWIIRDHFQSFGKGCRIIRRAEFLEEVRYVILLCDLYYMWLLSVALDVLYMYLSASVHRIFTFRCMRVTLTLYLKVAIIICRYIHFLQLWLKQYFASTVHV